MSSFIGVLLDISDTMTTGIGDDDALQSWAYSLFTVAFDLVRYDVSKSNRVFVVGAGAKNETETIDVIGTICQCRIENDAIDAKLVSTPASKETIESIYSNLESNGAYTVRQWADSPVIERSLSEYLARLILRKLQTDKEFTRKFVHEILPLPCRNRLVSKVVAPFRTATIQEIQEVILKAVLKDVDEKSIYSVQDAADVLLGYSCDNSFSTDRVRVLLKVVEPFIYGRTPLYSALKEASNLFLRSIHTHPHHRRLLFVLSDGYPSDKGDLENMMLHLHNADVTVVCCYFMEYSYVNPKRLYSAAEQKWEDGAKFLFKLCSKIPTDLIPRAIFFKYGWQIDITNNETKLLFHINHPDNVNDVCNIARNAVCCQDALSELLVSVSLDIYICQQNRSTEAPHQVGGTCYANASATVLHLAMHRILGRDNGYPAFEELRDDLINRHGVEGANTFRVLKEVCPLYRLHCQQVDINGAMKAITAKRPVVARFRLTDDEWKKFSRFFERHPTGILKRRDLDITRRQSNFKCGGHAVVLTSYNSQCLRLMNSWGDNFGDMGFFRIENAEVLGLEFIDIFWTLDDLSDTEKDYYKKHGPDVADNVMRTFKAFQMATFSCPLCYKASKITEFRGTMSSACCPKCKHVFAANNEKGNILALNMYLTSLCR